MKCKKCGTETNASLCNVCFLEELLDAIDLGEVDPSKIIRRMVVKYGRLRGLKRLPAYKRIFGKQRIRRVITTETGERCRLVPGYDGWIAVTEGPAKEAVVEEGVTKYPPQSAEGGRIVTYYEGQTPILEFTTPSSLVFRRPHTTKRTKYVTSGAPSRHYKSPIAHERPPSPLDQA